MKESNERCEPERDAGISYRTPIYLQLREIIRNMIEDGEYPPGTAIPSENELADTYGINRITVRSAVDALVKEGMLRRVQGKGMFVCGTKYEQELDEIGGFVSSFSDNAPAANIREQVKMLRPAGDLFANIFKIDPEDPIFYLRQLTSIDGKPISVEEIYVPQEVIPQLDEVNSSVFSMRDVFAFYGVEVFSMRQSLEIVTGFQKMRKILCAPEDTALIMMECTYKDKRGCVVEYSKSFSRSDRTTFKVRMHKE